MPSINLHHIHIGKNGVLQNDEKHVDAIFTYLKDTNQQKLSIFFHGGLVPHESGIANAEMMAKILTHSHSVSFVWDTGIWETLGENLYKIYQTKLFVKLVEYVAKYVGKELLENENKGETDIDGIDSDKVQEELKKEDPFSKYDTPILNGAKKYKEDLLSDLKSRLEEEIRREAESPREEHELENILNDRNNIELVSDQVKEEIENEKQKEDKSWSDYFNPVLMRSVPIQVNE